MMGSSVVREPMAPQCSLRTAREIRAPRLARAATSDLNRRDKSVSIAGRLRQRRLAKRRIFRLYGLKGEKRMKSSLRPGVSRVNRITIDRERTIGFMGEEARTYATPSMILDIEHTCRELILEHADAGEDSVGMEVAVKHLAPTLMGMTVEIAVPVMAVEGRKVVFEAVGQGRARQRRRRHPYPLRRRQGQDPRAPQGQGRTVRGSIRVNAWRARVAGTSPSCSIARRRPWRAAILPRCSFAACNRRSRAPMPRSRTCGRNSMPPG